MKNSVRQIGLIVSRSIALAFVAASAPLVAAEKGSEQVNLFYGSLSYAVPIEVPPYHGLQPRMGLVYSSEGRNGFVGVGWTLGGLSTVERVNAGRGTPRFDGADIFLLDGQELVPCQPATLGPSCSTGGSHAAKIENYLRIRLDSASNAWTVWGKDGTRTILQPILTTSSGTVRWAEAQRIDTLGNHVDFTWSCADGDCYPAAISYNGYGVAFYREPRPDVVSFGAVTAIGETRHRLRSVVVRLGSPRTSTGTARASSSAILAARFAFGNGRAPASARTKRGSRAGAVSDVDRRP